MKFIYLIQTEGPTPPGFQEIEDRSKQNSDIDFLKLTFLEKHDGAIYLPNSTWTEGRNRLIQEARKRHGDYDYYILCDDDVEVSDGSWRDFEASLVKHEPALATPYYPSRWPRQTHVDAHTIYHIDAMANAVHRDLIEDRLLFPYYAKFDKVSWWISQLVVLHMAGILYGDHVMCSNALGITNGKHREYPRILSTSLWLEYENWIIDNVFEDELFARSRFHHHYCAEHVPARPMPPPRKSYRLTADERALLKRSGPYWSALAEQDFSA